MPSEWAGFARIEHVRQRVRVITDTAEGFSRLLSATILRNGGGILNHHDFPHEKGNSLAFGFRGIEAAKRLEIPIFFVTAAKRKTEAFARMLKGSPSVGSVEWVPSREAPDERILQHLGASKTRGPAVIVLDYACLGQETWQVLLRLQKTVSNRIVEWIVVGISAPLPVLPGLSWQNVTVLPSRPLACN